MRYPNPARLWAREVLGFRRMVLPSCEPVTVAVAMGVAVGLVSCGDAKKADIPAQTPAPATAPAANPTSPPAAGAPATASSVAAASSASSGWPAFEVKEGLQARPLLSVHAPAPAGAPLFASIDPKLSGLDFLDLVEPSNTHALLYRTGMASGAVATVDFNGDGWPDIFAVSGAGLNKLYLQTPTGGKELKFQEVTKTASGNQEGEKYLDGGANWGTGIAVGDVNNDGRPDIYVGNYEKPNQLFINKGSNDKGVPQFVDEAAAWGVAVNNATHTPSFADYDNDGDVDLYIATNRFEDPNGLNEPNVVTFVDGQPTLKPEYEKYYEFWIENADKWGVQPTGQVDILLRNDGGKFTDVTRAAGITGRGDGLAANWADFDWDGKIDLWVSNDFTSPDQMLRNNGDGSFSNIADQWCPHISWFSMGADTGDLNNDGFVDILTADMSATNHFKQKVTMGAMGGTTFLRAVNSKPPQYMRNTLLLGTGTNRFMEAGFLADLESSDWTWTVKFADLDCDGWQDVFFTNGTPREMNDSDFKLTKDMLAQKPEWEYIKDRQPRKEKNLVFKNKGHLDFEDASDAWGLGLVGVSYGAAHSDLDRDGDLDLVVMNIGDPISLYRNQQSGSHRIVVECRGQKNINGLGTRVEIVTEKGVKMIRQITGNSGYMSCNEPVAHFGLGQETKIASLTVRWSSGAVQTFKDVAADQWLHITEPQNATPAPTEKPAAPQTWLVPGGLVFQPHKEQIFDDFALQSLLPNKLSQLGPGIAVADVNADGEDDVWVGGAGGTSGGQAGELRLSGGGKMTSQWIEAFRKDKVIEDQGGIFFDADKDGDQDLYVVSGSYEFPKDDFRQTDRLYINDGQGNFSMAKDGALPIDRSVGSCAVAGDLDRDGDLDLFVGGRVVPGDYPQSPESRILRNDNGMFADVTDKLIPSLRQVGMVTCALWTDINADGWSDLMVGLEWGAIRTYLNKDGNLTDVTEATGLAPLTGWWNSITSGDVDNDGDIDYAVLNQGHNSKYHATPEKAVQLYYGDYFGEGSKQLVEAEFENDTLFPVRGRSCSSRAMPTIAQKFATYKEFASASLTQIYTPEALSKAQKWSVTTLDSGVILNDGGGRFTFKALPHLAQISPGFGASLTDIDADGKLDLIFANNLHAPQQETGNYDGGQGWLLKGQGDGTFSEVWPHQSGLMIPGDGKALVTLDFNADQRPDFIASQNNGAVLSFKNAVTTNTPVAIRLQGKKGNLTAVGARVSVTIKGKKTTQEVAAGSGYLSQQSHTLFFGAEGKVGDVDAIEVRWPDGSVSQLDHPPLTGKTLRIEWN